MSQFGSIFRWQQMVFTWLPTNSLFIHSETGVLFHKKMRQWGYWRPELATLALGEIPQHGFSPKNSRRGCRHLNRIWHLLPTPRTHFPRTALRKLKYSRGWEGSQPTSRALSLQQASSYVGAECQLHSVGNPDLEVWKRKGGKNRLFRIPDLI